MGVRLSTVGDSGRVSSAVVSAGGSGAPGIQGMTGGEASGILDATLTLQVLFKGLVVRITQGEFLQSSCPFSVPVSLPHKALFQMTSATHFACLFL